MICILAYSGSQRAPNLVKIIRPNIYDSINYCYDVIIKTSVITILKSFFHSSHLSCPPISIFGPDFRQVLCMRYLTKNSEIKEKPWLMLEFYHENGSSKEKSIKGWKFKSYFGKTKTGGNHQGLF